MNIKPLSPSAIEMLGQLFVSGPVWDGNCVSKDGRTELVDLGYAERGMGWQWLTRAGVSLAIDPSLTASSRGWKKWRDKAAAM